MLGGTYDRETFDDRLGRYRNEKARNMRRKKEAEMKRRIRDNNEMINVYRSWIDRLQPLSQAWTDCYNAMQYQLYLHEKLNDSR